MGFELSEDDLERIIKYDRRLLVPESETDEYAAETFGIFALKYEDLFHHFFNKMVYPEKRDLLVDEARSRYYDKIDNCLFLYQPNDNATFTTYLGAAIKNSLRDLLKKRRREIYGYSLDHDIEGQPADADESLSLLGRVSEMSIPMIDNELSDLIYDTLHQLPDKYRSVLVLRHEREFSYNQIATILDIPLGTVKSHIFRGREKIREKILSDYQDIHETSRAA